MVTVEDLEKSTVEFFKKFCNEDLLNNQPKWSEKWLFKGTVPNNDKKGLYDHLENDEVTYIGLGIGQSFDGSGLGSRISRYWKKSKDYSTKNPLYTPSVDKVDAIITLPFSDYNFYLACALEVYLIQKLSPIKNRLHSK